jgi:hypothetical protein
MTLSILGSVMWGMGNSEKIKDAVRQAVADARTEVTLSAHIEQCKTDKAEIKKLIQDLESDRRTMHAENQKKFDWINRFIWMATGFTTAITIVLKWLEVTGHL